MPPGARTRTIATAWTRNGVSLRARKQKEEKMAVLAGIRRLFVATTERWLRVREPTLSSPTAEGLGRRDALQPEAPARVREVAGLVTYQHAMDNRVEQSRHDLDHAVADIGAQRPPAEGSSGRVDLLPRGQSITRARRW